ncbi:MAG TPA: YcxB family protein [Acidobacteriaceae bacterium]
MTPQTVSYDATFEDFDNGYALFKRICKKQANSMKRIRFFALLWLLACIISIVMNPRSSYSPAVIGLAFGALCILFVVPWQQQRAIRKSWDKMVTPPSITLPITVTFDDEHISILRQGNSEARFFWSAILRVAEDERTFLLLVNERMFYYIPKRVLSEELLDSLRTVAPMERQFKC